MYRYPVSDCERFWEIRQSEGVGIYRSGFIVILCKVSWNAFLHDRWAVVEGKEVGGLWNKKKMREKGRRFGIYNLAWRNTVISCHNINLCKCPHISNVCPSMLPNTDSQAPFPTLPAYKTQAQHTKIHLAVDWHNKHTSFIVNETSTYKKNRSTLISFLALFFLLPLPSQGFLSLSVCLWKDENNTN